MTPRTSGSPLPAGIPLWSASVVKSLHAPLIDRLVLDLDLTDPTLCQAFERTLDALMAWIHLLPASQMNHHAGQGGLLRHSLEVAAFAVRLSLARVGDLTLPPPKRREREQRFRLAVALAGLCHDLGKPVSDLKVLDPSGDQVWNPWEGSLLEWGQRLGIEDYHLLWIRHRGTRHRHFSPMLLRSVVDPELFRWLREEGPGFEADLLDALIESETEGQMAGLVRKADQESAGRDLKDPRRELQGLFETSPSAHLITAMRRLVSEGTWRVNLPGNALWLLKSGLYLAWPSACDDLRTLLQKDRLGGIPFDADLLAQYMSDEGLAAGDGNTADEAGPFAYLRPLMLKSPIRLLRLRSPALIFGQPVPEWIDHEDPEARRSEPDPGIPEASTSEVDAPSESSDLPDQGSSVIEPSALIDRIRSHSERFAWQLHQEKLFIDHLEASRALGMDPMGLIRALESTLLMETEAGGTRRRVRVHRGKRGVFLNPEATQALLPGMRVPLTSARRSGGHP